MASENYNDQYGAIYQEYFDEVVGYLRRRFPPANNHQLDYELLAAEAISASVKVKLINGEVPSKAYVKTAAYHLACKETKKAKERALRIHVVLEAARLNNQPLLSFEEAERRCRQSYTMFDVYRELVRECEKFWEEGRPHLLANLRRKQVFERILTTGLKPGEIVDDMHRHFQGNIDLIYGDKKWFRDQTAAIMDKHDVHNTLFTRHRPEDPSESEECEDRAPIENPPHSPEALEEIKLLVEEYQTFQRFRSKGQVGVWVARESAALCPAVGRLMMFSEWEAQNPNAEVPLELDDVHYHVRVRNCRHCNESVDDAGS